MAGSSTARSMREADADHVRGAAPHDGHGRGRETLPGANSALHEVLHVRSTARRSDLRATTYSKIVPGTDPEHSGPGERLLKRSNTRELRFVKVPKWEIESKELEGWTTTGSHEKGPFNMELAVMERNDGSES